MEPFVAFKYLHILAMFFGVALALSGEVVLRRVADSHDVRAIRIAVRRVKRAATWPPQGLLPCSSS